MIFHREGRQSEYWRLNILEPGREKRAVVVVDSVRCGISRVGRERDISKEPRVDFTGYGHVYFDRGRARLRLHYDESFSRLNILAAEASCGRLDIHPKLVILSLFLFPPFNNFTDSCPSVCSLHSHSPGNNKFRFISRRTSTLPGFRIFRNCLFSSQLQ